MGGLNNKHCAFQFWRLAVQGQGAGRFGVWWDPSSWFTPCPHMVEGGASLLSGVCVIRGPIWFMTYQGPPLLRSLPWELGFHLICGGGHIQTLPIITHHRKNKKWIFTFKNIFWLEIEVSNRNILGLNLLIQEILIDNLRVRHYSGTGNTPLDNTDKNLCAHEIALKIVGFLLKGEKQALMNIEWSLFKQNRKSLQTIWILL